jgi:hypothetical protein
MNFEMTSDATKEQINATIEHGLDALIEAHANGRPPANVAFMFEGNLPVEQEGEKTTVLDDDSKEEDEDETQLTLDGVDGVSPLSTMTNAKFAKTILVYS